MGMVDISQKEVVSRSAEAAGLIRLKPQTIQAVRAGRVKKGDPLPFAEAAGMLAVKSTPGLIPHCHPIPIEKVDFGFELTQEGIEARCTVKALARTGVEMEALIGLTVALNTLWDMVKYLEKDDRGQYQSTRITDVRVVHKIKRKLP